MVIQALCLCQWVKKYGFTYAYPPLFTQQLGLLSLQPATEEKAMEFISAIPAHYRYIEMNLNEKKHDYSQIS
jgi:hypothetical protein